MIMAIGLQTLRPVKAFISTSLDILGLDILTFWE